MSGLLEAKTWGSHEPPPFFCIDRPSRVLYVRWYRMLRRVHCILHEPPKMKSYEGYFEERYVAMAKGLVRRVEQRTRTG
jgi:hypothetical protein